MSEPAQDRGNGALRVVTPRRGLLTSVKRTVGRAQAMIRLERELAALELKKKATQFGVGAGLGLVAIFFLFFGLLFMFATIAAGLATVLPVWASLLIVTVGLFLLCALFLVLARGRFRRGTPFSPEAAIREAKLTAEALKR
ncbi:MAG TPA: phage holin family protein [Gaiellaceae bacterium]|nr:phage holin family protein [Gaiellaceae bacterium]